MSRLPGRRILRLLLSVAFALGLGRAVLERRRRGGFRARPSAERFDQAEEVAAPDVPALDAPAPTPTEAPAPRRVTRRGVLKIVLVAAGALGIALYVQTYVIKLYRIPSGSMQPTLHIGDHVLVNRAAHGLGAVPKVGQVVVFHPPKGADSTPARCGAVLEDPASCRSPTPEESARTFIKRVVGVGGDRIVVRAGHVLRNGVAERDPYVAGCPVGDACNIPTTVTVPPGYLFMMGDNREVSDDSRFWGPIPQNWVIGQAIVVYWPLNRFGTL